MSRTTTDSTPRLPYRTGTRDQVLVRMARYAIRDQEALIDALTPEKGAPDPATEEAILLAKAYIHDFRKLAATAKGVQR